MNTFGDASGIFEEIKRKGEHEQRIREAIAACPTNLSPTGWQAAVLALAEYPSQCPRTVPEIVLFVRGALPGSPMHQAYLRYRRERQADGEGRRGRR